LAINAKSKSTQEDYLRQMAKLALYCNKPPLERKQVHIRQSKFKKESLQDSSSLLPIILYFYLLKTESKQLLLRIPAKFQNIYRLEKYPLIGKLHLELKIIG
jgi:hypothetical protein